MCGWECLWQGVRRCCACVTRGMRRRGRWRCRWIYLHTSTSSMRRWRIGWRARKGSAAATSAAPCWPSILTSWAPNSMPIAMSNESPSTSKSSTDCKWVPYWLTGPSINGCILIERWIDLFCLTTSVPNAWHDWLDSVGQWPTSLLNPVFFFVFFFFNDLFFLKWGELVLLMVC